MGNKLSKQGKATVLKIFLMIIIISGLANCAYLLSIPTDSKNSFFISFSLNRVALVGLIISGVVIAYILYLDVKKNPDKFVNKAEVFFSLPYTKSLLSLLLVIVIIFCWLVPKNFQINLFYIERLLPVFLFITTIATVLILLNYFMQNEWELLINLTSTIVFGFVIALFLLILFLFPRLNNGTWTDSASVPVLAIQVIGVWLTIAIVKQFYGEILIKIPRFVVKNLDKIIFVFLWLCAAFFWVNQPVEFPEGRLTTKLGEHIKPLPPNHEIYPYGDAKLYFTLSESIIIGSGIFRSIDKPLFLTFESLNNWLTGGSFEKMMNLQVVILALFPPVLYLLGKEIHSRSAGLMAALLAVFHEINAIQVMRDFPVTSSKILLSEPFMVLWTALIALTAVVAFKRGLKKQANLFLICGGVLGLSALFRLNTLIIIPFLLLAIIINYFDDKKTLFKYTCMFLVGIVLAFTPWMIHNTVKYNDPLAFIKGKGAVINRRQEKITGQEDSQNDSFDYSPAIINVPSNFNNLKLLDINAKEINSNYLLTSKKVSEGMEPNNLGKNVVEIQKPTTDFRFKSSFANSGLSVDQLRELVSKILRHFLNNIISSFSIFPTSINPQTQHFWKGYHDSDLYRGTNLIFLIFNLLTISAGVTAAIRYQKNIGLIPLAVFFGYHLSNGLALASGNRYAQPPSWILLLYYSIGLATYIRHFIIQKKENKVARKELPKGFILPDIDKKQRLILGLAIFFILVIGSTPIMADLFPVKRFPEIDDELIARKMLGDPGCQEKIRNSGFENAQDFLDLANEIGYSASIGRVLTPIRLTKEEIKQFYPKIWRGLESDNDLLTFSFLEPKSANPYQLFFYPGDPNFELRNGSDALIISFEGYEAAVIGTIDPSYASKTMSYDDLAGISFSCYLSDSYDK